MVSAIKIHAGEFGPGTSAWLYPGETARIYLDERYVEFPMNLAADLEKQYKGYLDRRTPGPTRPSASGPVPLGFAEWLEYAITDKKSGAAFHAQGARLVENPLPWIAKSQLRALLDREPPVDFIVHADTHDYSRGYVEGLCTAHAKQEISLLPEYPGKTADKSRPSPEEKITARARDRLAGNLVFDRCNGPVVKFRELPEMIAGKIPADDPREALSKNHFRVVSDKLYLTRYGDDLPKPGAAPKRGKGGPRARVAAALGQH